MPKKKPLEPIVVNPHEPIGKCYDCIHWHHIQDANEPDAFDFSSGSCDENGYSKVPPLFTCGKWSQ